MRFNLFMEGSEKDFDYSYLAKEKWRNVLGDAQKSFGISFDTENDDKIVSREIIVPQTFWDFTKCKFHCELRKAGGDWQCPIVYFRCQMINGYANIPDKHNGKLFCFIPNKTEGNSHLTTSKNGKLVAPDNNEYYKKRDYPEPNEKKCWDSLKNYLKKIVDEEIDIVKKSRNDS